MKLALKLVFLLTVIPFVFPLKAYADTFCQPIYGGGQTCITTGNIQINKTVLNPGTNKMVDGLSINDPKFEPGFIVTFQINLTNVGNAAIAKARVSDIFPQHVNFSAGPGNFDNNTKTLTFDVDNLAPNETRTFTILGRVVDVNQLPISQGVVCVVNQAIAVNVDSTSQGSQDNSQLCIERKAVTPLPETKGGFPILTPSVITVTPSTGPEALVVFSMVPLGAAGYFLRKKSLSRGGEK